ncbi:GNAT family N-acetyltransferase [Streptomyces syringium]|uniref:GNAT family N-acetyltransferase n=1 Tax=Streptomyces syringium TaxID=76729 RepID=UPI00367C6E61
MERPPEALEHRTVRLVRWRTGDAEWALKLVTEALDHLRPYMPWADGYSAEQNLAFLRSCEQAWDAGTSFQYSVHHRGRPAGSCGLLRRPGTNVMEIGYWLHPDHTGKGLATDSARLLVTAAFALSDVGAVEIVHDAGNHASGAVPRRLDFTRIGMRSSQPPLPPADSGTEVIWSLTRHQTAG